MPIKEFIKAFLIVIFMSASLIARGDTWIAVFDKEGERIEIDTDSFERRSPENVRVTWRDKPNYTSRYSQHESVINCSTFSIRDLRFRFVDPNILEKWQSKPVDYEDPSLPVHQRRDTTKYWGWTGGRGMLIRMACAHFDQSWSQQWLDIGKNRSCANPSDHFTKLLCDQNKDFVATFNLLIKRGFDIEEACKNDRASLASVTKEMVQGAAQCQSVDCAVKKLEFHLYDFGNDLERAGRGEKCTAVTRGLERIEQDKSAQRAVDKMQFYFACVKNAAPRLDDGLSSAETIATALHSRCQNEFSRAVNESSEIRSIAGQLGKDLQPKVIELVLEYRAGKKKKIEKP